MADAPTINDTDIRIANAALGMLGSGEIFSWDEETELAAKVNAIYLDAIGACITAYDWTFGRQTVQLQQLAGDPGNGWRFGYALPAGRIGQPSAYYQTLRSREPLRDFALALDAGGNQSVYADVPTLWARSRMRPAVSLWPPAFRLFAIKALAAELAIPVSHDANLGAAFRDDAWGPASTDRRGGLFAKAVAADLNHPGYMPMYGSDPLTDAWHGGV